jgi:hypothetical protein
MKEIAQSKTLHTDRPTITLFTRRFSSEGKFEHMVLVQNTEVKARATTLIGILILLAGGGGEGQHVLYHDGNLKGLARGCSRDAELQAT